MTLADYKKFCEVELGHYWDLTPYLTDEQLDVKARLVRLLLPQSVSIKCHNNASYWFVVEYQNESFVIDILPSRVSVGVKCGGDWQILECQLDEAVGKCSELLADASF